MKNYKQIMQKADRKYDNLRWYEKLFIPKSLFTIDYYNKENSKVSGGKDE